MTSVQLLSDGPTNRSFRVRRDDKVYVLRLDKRMVDELGLDRESETAIQIAAADAGIAPLVLQQDSQAGLSIRSWAEGAVWSSSDLQDSRRLRGLAATVRQLHELPLVGRSADPLFAARVYCRQIETTAAQERYRSAADLYQELINKSGPPRICHNDLVCGNIVGETPIQLIDWEWAGIGPASFDLAVILIHHELDEALATVFLESYFGHSPDTNEMESLDLACRFLSRTFELVGQFSRG